MIATDTARESALTLLLDQHVFICGIWCSWVSPVNLRLPQYPKCDICICGNTNLWAENIRTSRVVIIFNQENVQVGCSMFTQFV